MIGVHVSEAPLFPPSRRVAAILAAPEGDYCELVREAESATAVEIGRLVEALARGVLREAELRGEITAMGQEVERLRRFHGIPTIPRAVA